MTSRASYSFGPPPDWNGRWIREENANIFAGASLFSGVSRDVVTFNLEARQSARTYPIPVDRTIQRQSSFAGKVNLSRRTIIEILQNILGDVSGHRAITLVFTDPALPNPAYRDGERGDSATAICRISTLYELLSERVGSCPTGPCISILHGVPIFRNIDLTFLNPSIPSSFICAAAPTNCSQIESVVTAMAECAFDDNYQVLVIPPPPFDQIRPEAWASSFEALFVPDRLGKYFEKVIFAVNGAEFAFSHLLFSKFPTCPTWLNGNQRARIQLTVAIPRETTKVCKDGRYTLPDGRVVDISNKISATLVEPVTPKFKLLAPPGRGKLEGVIEVTQERTLGALWRLIVQEKQKNVIGLCFGDACSPAKGYKKAFPGQEQMIHYCTNMHDRRVIQAGVDYYEANKWGRDGMLFSDYALVTREVVVFRDDEYAFLAEPFLASFLTIPAPIASEEPEQAKEVMRKRIERLLKIAIVKGFQSIVLGAFGCGQGRHTPADVAADFKEFLVGKELRFHFGRVVFAIPEFCPTDEGIFTVFRDSLAQE